MQLESKLKASDLSIYFFMIKGARFIVSGLRKSDPKQVKWKNTGNPNFDL